MAAITVGAAIVPVEFKLVSVPTLVILVCAAVDSVPVRVAPLLPIVPALIVDADIVPESDSVVLVPGYAVVCVVFVCCTKPIMIKWKCKLNGIFCIYSASKRQPMVRYIFFF